MIHFELLTPEKTFLVSAQKMVIVPGIEGDMGILEGHVRLVSRLRPGMVVAQAEDDTRRTFFVQGGFVDIEPERVSVLAENITDLKEVLPVAVEAQIEACKDEKEHKRLLALQDVMLNPPYPID